MLFGQSSLKLQSQYFSYNYIAFQIWTYQVAARDTTSGATVKVAWLIQRTNSAQLLAAAGEGMAFISPTFACDHTQSYL